MSSATNTRTGDPTRQVGVSEGGTRKPGTKSNIGAGTRTCGQTHVCVAVRNNVSFGFCFGSWGEFSVEPFSLLLKKFFFFFAFLTL